MKSKICLLAVMVFYSISGVVGIVSVHNWADRFLAPGFSWNDSINWYPPRVPNSEDTVVFDDGGLRVPGRMVDDGCIYWNLNPGTEKRHLTITASDNVPFHMLVLE